MVEMGESPCAIVLVLERLLRKPAGLMPTNIRKEKHMDGPLEPVSHWMNRYRPKTTYIQAMALDEQNLLDAMILTKGKILSLPLRLEIVDQNGTLIRGGIGYFLTYDGTGFSIWSPDDFKDFFEAI